MFIVFRKYKIFSLYSNAMLLAFFLLEIFIKIRLKYIFLTNDGVFCRTGLHAAPGLYGGVLLFFNC